MSPEVIFARHGFARLADRLRERGGRRALLLVAPSRRGVEPLAEALRELRPVVFDGARVHVPVEVVERAAAALAESEADTLVSLGGGSAIGLGKALRLRHEVRLFAAVPTTYSGSEMTAMYGTTEAGAKKTGRDPRVRPDLILYDAALQASLPTALSVQSLMNALAHVASVLSTDSLDGDARAAALRAAATVLRAAEDLLLAPGDLHAREAAMRGASACGAAFDGGKAGAQHALAHLLGGALDLDHAALHALLLPQFVAHLRAIRPALVEELERAVGRAPLDAALHDLLSRAGAPLSLAALGADPAAVRKAVAARPDLPAAIAADAQLGLRPAGASLEFGGTTALLAGPHPARARRTVLALHGRGAEPGGIVRRYREIAGHDPDVAIVGLRAPLGDRWYSVRYAEPGAGSDAEVDVAIALVNRALAELPGPLVLAGFSQGACLALEVVARHRPALAAVIAPCGGRIGQPPEWAPAAAGSLEGLPVLLGAGDADPWVQRRNLEATAAWFRAAGAAVEEIASPGDRHDIALRQRLRARAAILGVPASAGATGFGNTVESEALPGALPRRQNSPRLAPHGLYAEQVNGTGFTAARAENLRSWLYRIRPSTQRRAFAPLEHPRFAPGFEGRPPLVNLAGLPPLPDRPAQPADFLDGIVTLGGAGSAALRRGYAVHRYACDRDMERRAFANADGDLLLVPELGALTVMTELGPLEVAPGDLAILPRGILFAVHLDGSVARGYLAEAFGRHFRLPERGPIGANALADPRHFRAPAAWHEDKLAPDFRIVTKLGGRLHQASQDHSPFDVVAWHGNYTPYAYHLDDFSPVGNTRFDHGDPSVYTVVSAPLDEPGAHTLDLVVFPPRWDATTGTFRPPFFHRNAVTEVNGIVRESPPEGSPFRPGCCFLTPPFTAHGPSGRAVERERGLSDVDADRPVRLGESLWFQLESALPIALTPWSEEECLPEWPATWGSHRSYFG
jgi:homogentisate 1,2-dioxygenase